MASHNVVVTEKERLAACAIPFIGLPSILFRMLEVLKAGVLGCAWHQSRSPVILKGKDATKKCEGHQILTL